MADVEEIPVGSFSGELFGPPQSPSGYLSYQHQQSLSANLAAESQRCCHLQAPISTSENADPPSLINGP